MNREPNNRSIKNIPDLFDEALELEETIVLPSPEDPDLLEKTAAESAEIPVDPTFFDEQVINVPIIDPPDMKSISSYPDTQIYDHLFSTDDDFLLDEEAADDDFLLDAEAVADVISSMNEDPAVPETIEPEKTVSGKKPSKKPVVKRAGMPKEEIKTEEPVEITQTEKPARKKPRVRRAGETVATATAATAAVTPDEETLEAPPIELMEVSTPRVTPKRPAGKPDVPQKKTAGRSATTHKKPTGARPSGKPAHRSEEASPSAKPLRSKAVEEKTEQSKRSFSPLEKMRKKLARKWS